MPRKPKPTPAPPVATLLHWPYVFTVTSRSKPDSAHLVSLMERGFKGSCTCRYNRLAGLQCAHLKASREAWWACVAPRASVTEVRCA